MNRLLALCGPYIYRGTVYRGLVESSICIYIQGLIHSGPTYRDPTSRGSVYRDPIHGAFYINIHIYMYMYIYIRGPYI